MEDVASQIAVTGGQVTVSVGVVIAGATWIIKKWSEKYAEAQELRRRNTELEEKVNAQRARDTDEALVRLKAVVENHAKMFGNLGERMRRLESKIDGQEQYVVHLTRLLEAVVKMGSERVKVGKDATLVRDRKSSGEGENG